MKEQENERREQARLVKTAIRDFNEKSVKSMRRAVLKSARAMSEDGGAS